MNWKKIEDWFVESAATIIARLVLAIVGFSAVFFLGLRIRPRFFYEWFEDRGEAREAAIWLTLGCAVIVAILCALVGPRIMHHDVDPRKNR